MEGFLLKKISKLKLNQFFSNLQSDYEVYLPIQKGDIYEFEILKNDSVYNLLEPTYTSFKKIIFPQKQEVSNFMDGKFVSSGKPFKRVIFGLNSEDIQAVNILRDIAEKPIVDQVMMENLESTSFVLVVEGQIKKTKIIVSEITEGYDLLVIKIDDEFYFDPATEKGKDICSHAKMQHADLDIEKNSFSEFALFSNKQMIADVIEKSRGDKIWSDLAKVCLGCGNCTDVCPLCYCFDLKDEFSHHDCGSRCRMWDSCFYKKFDQTTNYNFREKLEDRIYHFFHHKFVQAYNERGEFNCNHCGRCVRACPVDINIFKVLSELIKKYGENNGKK